MKIRNVLLATKQTSLEYYRQKYDNLEEVLSSELLQRKKLEHEEHYSAFSFIKSVLEKNNISYQRVYMPYAAFEEFENRDLIISVGGDGTVINTARYVLDSTPVLTVKSEGDSVGALCKINAVGFEDALNRILGDDFDISEWARIEGTFNNKTDYALNEIAIGPMFFSGTARYKVSFNGFEEEQRSSKLIISTGAGSTGWYSNLEYAQGSFSPSSRDMRFCVSEDFKHKNYKLKHGVIQPHQSIEVISLMDVNGKISFDGDMQKRFYDFPLGSKLIAKISNKPLSVVGFY